MLIRETYALGNEVQENCTFEKIVLVLEAQEN